MPYPQSPMPMLIAALPPFSSPMLDQMCVWLPGEGFCFSWWRFWAPSVFVHIIRFKDIGPSLSLLSSASHSLFFLIACSDDLCLAEDPPSAPASVIHILFDQPPWWLLVGYLLSLIPQLPASRLVLTTCNYWIYYTEVYVVCVLVCVCFLIRQVYTTLSK